MISIIVMVLEEMIFVNIGKIRWGLNFVNNIVIVYGDKAWLLTFQISMSIFKTNVSD